MSNLAGRPLVIGGDGRIGRALTDALTLAGKRPVSTTRKPELVVPGRPFLDLQDRCEQWDAPDPISFAYFCGGVTSIEQCHRDPEGTARVNVHAPVQLASQLHARGAHVVFLSSNLVFDGTKPYASPDDTPNPQTEYGRQKLHVERAVLDLGERVVVLRLTKVLGPATALFLNWSRSLKAGSVIRPFADVVLSPLPLSLVVRALIVITEPERSGIVQLSGQTDVSYLDIANRLARQQGASPALVLAISAREQNSDAEAVPGHTCLDTTRMKKDLGLDPPRWESAIDQATERTQSSDIHD